MGSIFREIFSDESGHLSSNRVLGAIGWLVGLVLAGVGRGADATVVMTAAGAMLGVGQIKSAIVKSQVPEATQPKTKPTDKHDTSGDSGDRQKTPSKSNTGKQKTADQGDI